MVAFVTLQNKEMESHIISHKDIAIETVSILVYLMFKYHLIQKSTLLTSLLKHYTVENKAQYYPRVGLREFRIISTVIG